MPKWFKLFFFALHEYHHGFKIYLPNIREYYIYSDVFLADNVDLADISHFVLIF